VLLLKGSAETARMNFEKLLENASQDAFWMFRLGLLYLRAGKATMAAAALVKASEKTPDIPYLWYKLGQAYMMLRNRPKALASFGRALEIEPVYKPALEAMCVHDRGLSFGDLLRWVADLWGDLFRRH
jgi:tetratricopeptide (TPR) repeat protein